MCFDVLKTPLSGERYELAWNQKLIIADSINPHMTPRFFFVKFQNSVENERSGFPHVLYKITGAAHKLTITQIAITGTRTIRTIKAMNNVPSISAMSRPRLGSPIFQLSAPMSLTWKALFSLEFRAQVNSNTMPRHKPI